MIIRPTMTVLVDGEEVRREIDHVEFSDDGFGGGIKGRDRYVPRTSDDEMVIETLDGPPVIVRTGIV